MPNSNRRLLHVETNSDLTNMLRELLRMGEVECNVEVVETAEEAKRRIKKERFDLYVVGDIEPDPYDCSVTKLIRTVDDTVPIIVFSSADRDKDIFAAYSDGASTYLCKPHDIPFLVDLIKRFLG